MSQLRILGLGLLTLVTTTIFQNNIVQAIDLDLLEDNHACENNESKGCYNLAVRIHNQKRYKEAIPKFEQVCGMGLCESCMRLPVLHGFLSEKAKSKDEKISALEKAIKASERARAKGCRVSKKLDQRFQAKIRAIRRGSARK